MIVDVPPLPCTTETEVGEAEMVKLGVVDVGARALIRLAPVRTAPAGIQIVASYCWEAVIAAGDVVEIGVIAGRQHQLGRWPD